MQEQDASWADTRASRFFLENADAPATGASAASNHHPACRVTSYNILSEPLSTPEIFPFCDEKALDPARRFRAIIKKLGVFTKRGDIICLQEVCRKWMPKIHSFFAKQGYICVVDCNGRDKTGNMGSALAWPAATFQVEDIWCQRPSDLRPWSPDVVEIPVEGNFAKYAKPWTWAINKNNTFICARLHRRQGNGDQTPFCVASYHMPCAYQCRLVMQIHAALLVQSVAALARGAPFCIAGDFNTQPGDRVYDLITKGEVRFPVDEGCTSFDGYAIECKTPLRSAYAFVNGKEPSFTNCAQSPGESAPFIACLDYIFVSEGWTPVAVSSTPSQPPQNPGLGSGGALPLPTLDEPSDHLAISTELVF
jgi:hypothetical protein